MPNSRHLSACSVNMRQPPGTCNVGQSNIFDLASTATIEASQLGLIAIMLRYVLAQKSQCRIWVLLAGHGLQRILSILSLSSRLTQSSQFCFEVVQHDNISQALEDEVELPIWIDATGCLERSSRRRNNNVHYGEDNGQSDRPKEDSEAWTAEYELP